MVTFLILLIGLGLLFFWSRDRNAEIQEKVRKRQNNCPHPPEAMRTLRVNNIMTMNPALINRVIPGRRWVVKMCSACGKTWDLYRPTLQPWDEFKSEYDMETRDREAQYASRWKIEQANRESRKNGRAK